MRRVVFYFICAEILDMATTIIGLRMGMVEQNPLVYSHGWDFVILLKIVITIFVAIILQIKKKQKTDIIIPWLAVSPAIWNSAMIILHSWYWQTGGFML